MSLPCSLHVPWRLVALSRSSRLLTPSTQTRLRTCLNYRYCVNSVIPCQSTILLHETRCSLILMREFGMQYRARSSILIDQPQSCELMYQQKSLHVSAVQQAGHSKWQNIRHIKATKDQQRSKITSKLVMKIKSAVQEGGSSDPGTNLQLAHIIEQCKKNDIPNSTWSDALKKSTQKGNATTAIVLAGRHTSGAFFVLEGEVENSKAMREKFKGIARKQGVMAVETSHIKMAFEHKGVILVDSSSMALDDAENVAIEVGAEDVSEIPNMESETEGTTVFQFVCDANDFFGVRKEMAQRALAIQSAQLQYVPLNKVPVSDDDMARLAKFVHKLEEMEEYMSITDNIE
ncbi:PREDICTED: translational activator of cytochrome c oxidase 1-like [Priapulus caudatus]|uniref:Translational activator of cytochrome c oxidase 1-like n=1 Tax=Priapulus caudatus TaxID=37621 RepID=A0ABM1DYG7_PRICU|nr:PREDICTED: translational activator of cytochrome c oxidase 1-like [Priapulus caudatus]